MSSLSVAKASPHAPHALSFSRSCSARCFRRFERLENRAVPPHDGSVQEKGFSPRCALEVWRFSFEASEKDHEQPKKQFL